MKLRIPKDYFDNPTPPRLFLCTTGKKVIGELPAYDIGLNASWNKYSELRFSIDRQYTDVITGETKVNPLFDKAEGLRKVYVENMGYFTIQDPNETYSDKDSKSFSAFSCEYETASKYLENFRINTGEVDSAEVMYLENIYGVGYTIDTPYELAPLGDFDKYESYYIKNYTDNDSYVYEQVEIVNKLEYEKYDRSTVANTLYRKKYPNVRFYWPTKQELSLVHLILKKIPEWTVDDADVDVSLWRKERKFDQDRIAVYDFLMNDVADTFKCVVEWDTITNHIHFYEEAEDGITEDNTIQSRFDTDIYITRENLANEINIRYSSDDIKTKLKVTGSDDLSIRDVNLGKNHIINLDFYHNTDWMETDLIEAYDNYLKTVKEYSPKYSQVVSARAGAYNRWNDLMNAVPAEGNVVLIGDPFEKLYCHYTPPDTAYYDKSFDIDSFVENLYVDKDFKTIIDKTDLNDDAAFIVQGYHFAYKKDTNNFKCIENIATTTSKAELVAKLNAYHVNHDVNSNKPDNILLKLKDKNSNTVTIRIYAPPAAVKDTDKFDINKVYYRQYVTNGRTFYSEVSVEGDKISGLYATTEDYRITYEVFNESSGLTNPDFVSTLDEWIQGEITVDGLKKKSSNKLDLSNYTVSHIGTMGAYFVLAKDETKTENIKDYGVNLLKEKHEVYTQIFRTQTENMYSQEKYQCASSDDPPEEPIPDKARWLDTNTSPSVLYIYDVDNYYNIGSYIKGMTYYTGDGEFKSIAVPQPTEKTFNDNNYYVKWRKTTDDETIAKDKKSHEDYQRYLDNYKKLGAVQEVLIQKQTEAEYCLNGYAVSDMRINIDDYNEKGLHEALHKAALEHFSKSDGVVTPLSEEGNLGPDWDKLHLPIFKFKHSDYPNEYVKATVYEESAIYYKDDNGKDQVDITKDEFANGTYYILSKDYTFAVYLKGKIPYVAFASSVGVNQAKIDEYSQATDFDNAFTPDQWIRLSPLVREDEFNDNNFLLTGYESEEERMSICQELMENASKELKTLSQPSLEFSMTMGNILALPEFKSLTSQFELGRFIRIELRPDSIKRARLLGVDLDFEDLSSFTCQFGNLVTTQDQIDLHAELMQQAVQAGKQVATSASNWQRAVDKSNKLEEEIANGLANATLEVGRASGQSLIWDNSGIWGRKLKEGSTDEYEDEQFRLVNNKLLFSNDGFKTSKSVMGKFVIEDDDGGYITRWGLLAEAMVGGYIEGSEIRGGSLRIGDGSNNYFKVDENGDVSIYQAGKEKYASVDSVKVIDDAYRYRTVLSYDKSTIFSNTEQDCTITCTVYSHSEDITNKVIAAGGSFSWTRVSSNATKDAQWNKDHIQTKTNTDNPNKVKLEVDDVEGNSQFYCSVDFDEINS